MRNLIVLLAVAVIVACGSTAAELRLLSAYEACLARGGTPLAFYDKVEQTSRLICLSKEAQR